MATRTSVDLGVHPDLVIRHLALPWGHFGVSLPAGASRDGAYHGIPLFPRRTVMSDDSQNRGEPDRSRINVQEHELRYWTQKLGITEERLRAVVREVGTMADKVREHLRSR